MALAALLVVVLGGIHLLREATMSTHYATGADSRLEVVVEVASNRAEHGVTLGDLAEAQLETCALEVSRTRDSEVVPVAGTDDRFAVTIQPALDSTNRKQYRGCLEDWSIDHVRVDVVSMTDGVAP